MGKSKEKTRKKAGRPLAGLYHMYILVAAALMRLRGIKLKLDRSALKGIKGPALVLSSHISLKDHIINGLALLPHRPTFVLSEHFVTKPYLGWVLKHWGHVVTKKMFCPDTSTIFGILRAKKENNIIVMFPEGRLNAVAHSQPVAEGTAELVKKLGIDVYTIAGNGAALAFPKWGEKYRRGVISITSRRLLRADEIAKMSVDEISAVVDSAIYHDDEKAMEGVHYKCRDTSKGLEYVLYKCPECGCEYKIYAGGGKVGCSSCGFETFLADDYRFTNGRMRSVNEWYYWQHDSLSLDTVMEDDIKIGAVNERGLMDFGAGQGHVLLDKEHIVLSGEIFGQSISLDKPTAHIGGMPCTPSREFDIYCNKKLLYLMPDDKRRIVKYVTLVDKVCEGNN